MLGLPALSDNGGSTQTHNPAGTSAVDSGAGCGGTDQRDMPRPQNGTCDKGAVEPITTNGSPVLTLPVGSRNYSAGSGPIILEPDATASDADSGDFTSLVINFQSGFTAGQDQLGLLSTGTGSGEIALASLSGANYVYYEGVVIGTYVASTSDITITFNRNDTTAAVEAMLPAVTFANTADPPAAGTRTVAFALTDADGNITRATTDIVFSAPGYGSTPAVNSPLDLGSTSVGNSVFTTLTVQETGNAALDVGSPSGGVLTGANPTDFVVSNGPPFTIADGGDDQIITVQCTPAAAGVRTALLTFTTNDPTQPTVSYPLNCTGETAPPTPTGTTAPPTPTSTAVIPTPTTTTITPTPSTPSPAADDDSDENDTDDNGDDDDSRPSPPPPAQEIDCWPWLVIAPSAPRLHSSSHCLSSLGESLPSSSAFAYLGHTTEVRLRDTGETPLTKFNPSVKICFRYTQAELRAVEGQPGAFLIQALRNGAWEALPTSPETDPSPAVLGRVCAPVDHLSQLGLFRNGEARADVSADNPLSDIKFLPETGASVTPKPQRGLIFTLLAAGLTLWVIFRRTLS